MVGLQYCNATEIRKAVTVLFQDVKFGKGECIEVRMVDKDRRLTACGYFDDPERLIAAVEQRARHGFTETSYKPIKGNVYWTINPVDDALLCRKEKMSLNL